MKLLRYRPRDDTTTQPRLGLMLSGMRIADLRRAYSRYLTEVERDPQADALSRLRIPERLEQLLELGDPAWAAVREVSSWLEQIEPETIGASSLRDLVHALDTCIIDAPLRPGKLIAVGRNYPSHTEAAGSVAPMQVPSAWIKATSAISGPFDDIVRPGVVKLLDYETELAFVIGKRCRNVPAERAYEFVAGYTIVNDVSARDITRIERKEANQLLGKMFDGFAPMGPWLVTVDEIADPMKLRLRTRVDGETRQDTSTSDMYWSIPQLIAYTSQMTLEPGDVITTGTPAGCAMERNSDLPPWWLQPGQLLESEIEGIGCMRNRIADDRETVCSWRW